MTKQNKKIELSAYQNKEHKIGRIFIAIAIVLDLSVPTIIAISLHTGPDWMVVGSAMMALIVFLLGGFVEVITYAPLLGTSGTYLAFFTGNLVNLKLPCVVNARDSAGVKIGTKEGEIVSSVSVASSTIVTTLVIALGVASLTPLTPVLQSPVLAPAFKACFTALFASLAYKYFIKDFKLVPLPLILCVLLAVFAGFGNSTLIPISVVVSILFAYLLFKKGVKLN